MTAKTKAELTKEITKLIRENKSLLKKLKKATETSKNTPSEKFLEIIFNNAGIGIVVSDLTGRPLLANKFILKALKYTQKEFYNLTMREITHPLDLDPGITFFEEMAKGKRNFYKIEKRYLKKDGDFLAAKVTASLIRDDKNKPLYIIALVEDLSSHKRIEKKLADEQNLFYTLMNNVPDSIYFKDLNSKFIKVNKSVALKHGYANPDDMIGKSDFDLFDYDHATQAYNDEQEIIDTGIPIIAKEEKETYIDGTMKWASTTKMPLYDEHGAIIGIVGITRDITKAKQIEEQLHESEQTYRSLFENSAEGMFLMTDIMLECNNAICEMFKCDKSYFLGRSPADFSPPFQPDGRDSKSSALEKINAALAGTPQRFKWQHTMPTGKIIDTEVSLTSVSIKGKKLIQAVVRDITERTSYEKVQNALFEISEAAYKASDMNTLYKRIHEIIGTLMPAKNFYIALYDEKDQMISMISFPYFVDEYDPPQPPKKLGKGLTEYVLRTGEAALVNAEKDLELRERGEVELIGAPQAIWLGIPLKLANKTIGVMVVQDYENENAFGEEEKQVLIFVSEQIAQVIERKSSSEAITKYAEELRQLNATKDKFFSIIAHDLKNPFITILGFADLLTTDFNELTPEEVLYYVTEMKNSAELSYNLLQNLLQWSRSQTGRIEFHPKKIDLKHIVLQNIELLKRSAQKKNISLNHEFHNELYVKADEDMIDTVLRNLITNAIKFTNPGGNVTISYSSDTNFATVFVKDNGVGMDESARSKIFRLDESYSTQGTANEAGTGLGLVLCKEFVLKNGGEIKVESQVGVGSTFSFTLPLFQQ